MAWLDLLSVVLAAVLLLGAVVATVPLLLEDVASLRGKLVYWRSAKKDTYEGGLGI